MEASAFLHTCLQLDILSLGVIKGVSDKANKDKGAKNKEETYKGALDNTAAAVKKRIQSRFHSYDPVPAQRQRSTSRS
jgi:nucleoside phosphorylase